MRLICILTKKHHGIFACNETDNRESSKIWVCDKSKPTVSTVGLRHICGGRACKRLGAVVEGAQYYLFIASGIQPVDSVGIAAESQQQNLCG